MSDSVRTAVIGIDLGGTKIAGAVVSADGAVLTEAQIPTEADRGVEHVIGRIVALSRQLVAQAGVPLAALGIGAPAPLSPSRGIVWAAPNMKGWHAIPLRQLLMDALGVPVALENDGRAAALAEFRLGAGWGTTNMLYITVGTGVGGALIVDGWPRHGATETAGEVGHMVMDPQGPLCGCGNRGCSLDGLRCRN